MSQDLLLTVLLLIMAVAMFTIGRPRIDVVAILVIVALPLTGVLSINEALSGFSDPNVILIAAMFVLGDGLVRTGLAYRMSEWLANKAGSSETRLLVLVMLMAAALGSVMSSTGVVAIFIPVVLTVARRMKSTPARLMMPLGFAGLISGMLTLVATPPNMVVQSELVRAGFAGLNFFSFTPIGLVVLVLGVGYMLVARRWLGGDEPESASAEARRTIHDLARDFKLAGREKRLLVMEGSPLIGKVLGEMRLRADHGINVIGIERLHGRVRRVVVTPEASTEVRIDDILLLDVFAPRETGNEEELCRKYRLGRLSYENTTLLQEIGMAEILVPPESQLIGKSVVGMTFRSKYNLNVIGLRREREALANPLETEIELGDVLLVVGSWKAIRQLRKRTADFLVLSLPAESDEVVPALERAPFALFSLGVAVALMVSGMVPNVMAALIGCLLMGAFRCIDLASLYKVIQWPSLVLIAGMLPIALALQKTGGINLAVEWLMSVVGDAGPNVVLASLFVMTALAGLFISNTATAVLMAPVAVAVAQKMDVSPYPFVMIVALAASAAFMTPISSPVTTLVAGPGNYRFMDFVRIGVPFTILVMIVSIVLVPLLFPF